MRYKHWTDFLFMGLGLLPAALLIGGRPEAAILVSFPPLFAAVFCSRFEQLESGMPADAVATEETEEAADEPHRLAGELSRTD